MLNNDGIGSVTPRSDSDGKETESSNPFVKLDVLQGEGSEYDRSALRWSAPAMTCK